MGDAPARTELKVTTGPIRGSRKTYVKCRTGVEVAMRAVDLEPSSGEPAVTLYDTSGPYTDPDARIDIMAGLPELRRDSIRGRGDVEAGPAPGGGGSRGRGDAEGGQRGVARPGDTG